MDLTSWKHKFFFFNLKPINNVLFYLGQKEEYVCFRFPYRHYFLPMTLTCFFMNLLRLVTFLY